MSATLFKPNTYLIGYDNLLWKIEKRKWTKVETITEKVKFNKNLIPNLEKMSAIGSYNMNGICYNISGESSPKFVTYYKITYK